MKKILLTSLMLLLWFLNTHAQGPFNRVQVATKSKGGSWPTSYNSTTNTIGIGEIGPNIFQVTVYEPDNRSKKDIKRDVQVEVYWMFRIMNDFLPGTVKDNNYKYISINDSRVDYVKTQKTIYEIEEDKRGTLFIYLKDGTGISFKISTE